MKDTPERPDELLPARRAYTPPPAPAAESFEDYAEHAHAQAPPRGFSLRVTFRALKRHWWWALPLWLAGSTGLATLAYLKIKPTYDAISRIEVQNTNIGIFKDQTAPIDMLQFMETQITILNGPTVVRGTLESDPSLSNLPMLRGSTDPDADIRKALRVAILPKTNIIQVELSSQAPNEAAEIVNALVKYYVDMSEKNYGATTDDKIRSLKETRKDQLDKVEQKRRDVQAQRDRIGNVNNDKQSKDRNAQIERYARFSDELTKVEIDLIKAKTELDQLRSEKSPANRTMDQAQVEREVIDLFYADPVVDALQRQRVKAEGRLKEVSKTARNQSDPSVVHASDAVKAVNAQIDELWDKRSGRLKQQVLAGPSDNSVEKAIAKAESNVSALKIAEEQFKVRLDQVRIENNKTDGESLKLEFLRRDLERAETVFDRIESTLSQLEYDAKTQSLKIKQSFIAQPSTRPDSARRTQAMAAAPLGTGALILGLLVLMELRGGRVSDPEELSTRMNLQVLGVVPPLPQIRVNGQVSAGALVSSNDLRAQRQLDEFVQSLDHLRVALCARKDPWGRDRHCFLITSACGSEGKTTLAAQLAERCVNAGLMTLLIDADLRNPTLSRMLDAPDNPGLINVLRGEVSAEDVVMVIGDAGGFHLLPAGTPRMDPSRLLASDRLGKLIAQARESFDMIIVDAPPVLPVPDALTLGRWTDGAVLAVRYDTSRFPLVERAHRRLSRVGVPVIGAVVNGVRSMESSYGGYYTYGYGRYGGGYGSTGEEPAPAASGPTSSASTD